jgi:hypothetical protein
MKHINSNKFMELIKTKENMLVFGPSGTGGPSVLDELPHRHVLNDLYEITHPKRKSIWKGGK